MKILAFLQNGWYREPARVMVMLERYPEKRNELIRRLLFHGSKTGKILLNIFGSDLCNKIIWDEASPEIMGDPRACPEYDAVHMRTVIEMNRPDVILCFGKTAREGMNEIATYLSSSQSESALLRYHNVPVICGPHPCARAANTRDRLLSMRSWLMEELFVKGDIRGYIDLGQLNDFIVSGRKAINAGGQTLMDFMERHFVQLNKMRN